MTQGAAECPRVAWPDAAAQLANSVGVGGNDAAAGAGDPRLGGQLIRFWRAAVPWMALLPEFSYAWRVIGEYAHPCQDRNSPR